MNKQKQRKKKNVEYDSVESKTCKSYKEYNVYSSEDEDFQLFLNERKKKQEIFKVYDKAIKKILEKTKNTDYVFEREKIERVSQDTEDEALEDINLILRNETCNMFSKRNKKEKQENNKKETILELSKKEKCDELIFPQLQPKWNQFQIEEDKIDLYQEHKEMTKNLRSGLCHELNNYFMKIFGNAKHVEALNEPMYEDGTLDEYLFYENKEPNINSVFDKNDSIYVNNNQESLKAPTNHEEKNLYANKRHSSETRKYEEAIDNYNYINRNISRNNKDLDEDPNKCNHSTEEYIKEIKDKNKRINNEKKPENNIWGSNFSVVTADIVVNKQKVNIGKNKRKQTDYTEYQNYKNRSQTKRIHTTLDKNAKPSIYGCDEEDNKKRRSIHDPSTNEMKYRTFESIKLNSFKNTNVTSHHNNNNDHSCYIANPDRKEHLKINTNNNLKEIQNKDQDNFINDKENTERTEMEKQVSLQEEEFSFQHFKKNSNSREIKQKLIYRVY